MSLLFRGIFETLINPLEWAILQVGRNSRFPKPANHGARPCSSVMRRLRKKEYYKKWKTKTPPDTEEMGSFLGKQD